MKISVIGAGHVGLVTGACFADMGHQVVCVDNDLKKIAELKKGKIWFFEPGLSDVVRKNYQKKRLSFSTSIAEAVQKTEVIFIAVGTPTKASGEADLSQIEAVAREVAETAKGYHLVVEKSTVPVETGLWIKKTLMTYAKKNRKAEFDVASNPEFLREGAAVHDVMKPDRIVIGVENKRAEKILRELYKPLNAPIIVTDINSAEIIKHASNSFLSTKISFINMVSQLCERVGADINKVAEGMGLDKRIGPSFLNAGIGFGGFCFPKDLAAFIHIAGKAGVDFNILKAVVEVNHQQKMRFVEKVKEILWNLQKKKIGALGLSFKPDTDDMRFAPAIDIINALTAEGAEVKAFDPEAMPVAKSLLNGITYVKNSYDAVKGVDALLILTEWNEFKELDLKKVKRLMKRPLILDGRNIFDPKELKALGFEYISVGRPPILN